MTTPLVVEDLRLDRGGFTLDATVEFPPGITAIVGPNGAGKSTLLAVIAGLLDGAAGTIRHGSRTLQDQVTWQPAAARRVGYVPQAGVLFPHLSALDNVAFGPRVRGDRAAVARAHAWRWLDRMGAGDLGHRRPHELSGGQAQRVALARALAVDPDVLLLDEPLAAVDVAARHLLQRDLRSYLDHFPGPALIVTHDIVEAASLTDRVVVLEHGRIAQSGSVADLARRPRTPWIARLVGVNLVAGFGAGTSVTTSDRATLVVAEPCQGPVLASIAPAAVALFRARPDGSPRNVWPVTVGASQPVGGRVRVDLDGPIPLAAEITPAGADALGLHPGAALWAAVKATDVEVFPA